MLGVFVFLSGFFFQNIDTAPLEALKLQGTKLSESVVGEVGGLRIGDRINQQSIQEACGRLQASGLFTSIEYKFGPGPKHGYVVTLTLVDQAPRMRAVIDLPDVSEEEAWTWLKSRYPGFDHRIPREGGAEDFLAGELARHYKDKLEGAKVAARMEQSFSGGGGTAMVFQLEVLPQITEIAFSGNKELAAETLSELMRKGLNGAGYTERTFREFLNGTVEQAYEEHGMYRVKFPKVSAKKTGAQTVAVATEVVEGPQFSLGEVRFVGDGLPVDKMLKAGDFQPGKMANWRDIQQGIFRTEVPVKRMGYLGAKAVPKKVLLDDQKRLDLEIPFQMGQLFHFGELRFDGFPPEAQNQARAMWKMAKGDPYDFMYASEFYKDYLKKVRFGDGKFSEKQGPDLGDHVIDLTLTFKPK